jgi:hypothetical protein
LETTTVHDKHDETVLKFIIPLPPPVPMTFHTREWKLNQIRSFIFCDKPPCRLADNLEEHSAFIFRNNEQAKQTGLVIVCFLLVDNLAYPLVLEMAAICSFKTLAVFCRLNSIKFQKPTVFSAAMEFSVNSIAVIMPHMSHQ